MVILVDRDDNAIGTMEKMEAHYKGALHRAFSIVLFNARGQMLLQKRSPGKYHSAGLWTNTCCSHPFPDEPIEDAARRRLREEMGIDAEMEFLYKFTYRVALSNNLIEHECDHVLIGNYDGDPIVNQHEVEDWKYVDVDWVKKDVQQNPENYTHWFKMILHDPQFRHSLTRS